MPVCGYLVPDAVRYKVTRRRAGTQSTSAALFRHAILDSATSDAGCLNMPFFVYILASKRNGTLYVGVTNDLVRRMTEHKAKLVPGFTRQYGVTLLIYFEAFDSILEARAREHSLKRWRRAWKLKLIEQDNPNWRDLTDELNTLAT
jgi:putative endonuclease